MEVVVSVVALVLSLLAMFAGAAMGVRLATRIRVTESSMQGLGRLGAVALTWNLRLFIVVVTVMVVMTVAFPVVFLVVAVLQAA